MLVIHHLGVSQSDRVVWLMEELGLPYKLVWHRRGADNLMPPSYVALHPAATAPVVEDGDKVMSESAAILEYICHKYAGGKLTVRPDQPNYFDYVYWMHFNNNTLGLFFARLALSTQEPNANTERMAGLLKRREDGYARFMEQTLSASPYLAGSDFTCADIMSNFNLVSLPSFSGRTDIPHVKAYVERIATRPAYIKAMKIAGPTATPPEGA
ncbi:MAG TPA: glutathione S-transferase [Rhizomicrobium sp.]|nr:glutathione S-transferase [Rhizomicrobium sp.]